MMMGTTSVRAACTRWLASIVCICCCSLLLFLLLQIRNDPKKGFFVENLTQNAVADYDSISKVRHHSTAHSDPWGRCVVDQ